MIKEHECVLFYASIWDGCIEKHTFHNQQQEIYKILYYIPFANGQEKYIQYCPYCGLKL